MSTALGNAALMALFPTLQRDGIASAPGLSISQIDDMWAWLRDRPRYAGHVKREGRAYTGQPISCWDMQDLILAPHFWEWALSFSSYAEAYLGERSLLYSLNVFESVPSDMPPHPGIEVFHRDYDDIRFIALFLYLTDIHPGDGSHLYQCGTQDGGKETRIVEICGGRGTAFFADTRGLHCGRRPTTGPRRLAWARWGVSDPPASYMRDQLQPIPRERLAHRYPSDPGMQRCVQLVAA